MSYKFVLTKYDVRRLKEVLTAYKALATDKRFTDPSNGNIDSFLFPRMDWVEEFLEELENENFNSGLTSVPASCYYTDDPSK